MRTAPTASEIRSRFEGFSIRSLHLRIVFLIQFSLFVFSLFITWTSGGTWAFLISNGIVLFLLLMLLIFGGVPEPVISVKEVALLLLVTHVLSIFVDITTLAIWFSRAQEQYLGDTQLRDTTRFSSGMCILNFLIKPFTTFIFFKFYLDLMSIGRARQASASFGEPQNTNNGPPPPLQSRSGEADERHLFSESSPPYQSYQYADPAKEPLVD